MRLLYRLLIVDDNPRDQKGLLNIIDWGSLGIAIIGAVDNGQEAISRMDELKPDIILTDITMPLMNGIEMSSILRKQYPHIKIIFMSSYYEFDYARSAVDLDVYAYILKPIVKDDLLQAVQKVLSMLKTEQDIQAEKENMLSQIQQSLHLFQEQFIHDLLFGSNMSDSDLKENAAFLQMNLTDTYFVQVIAIELDNYEAYIQNMETAEKYLISYTVKQSAACYDKPQAPIFLFQISSKRFAAVLFEIPDASKQDCTILDTIIAIKERISSHLHIQSTIGVSSCSVRLGDIPLLYEQSLEALCTKFYSNGDQLILYEEIKDRQTSSDRMIDLQTVYQEMQEVIFSGDVNCAAAITQKYLGRSSGMQNEQAVKVLIYNIIHILQNIFDQENISLDELFGGEAVIWKKLDRYETIRDVRQWLTNILSACIQYFNNSTNSQTAIVQQIKNIIHQKYAEPLSAETISALINFSPSYANRVFKAQTSKTIFDYLTEYRMERAKELLRSPNSKIYVVAQEVGYTNKSHFCYQFKKQTGMTPSKFKDASAF